MIEHSERKRIKKEIQEKSEQRKLVRDENGSIVINMIVKDDDGFLSEFSKYETPIISNDVAEFLEDSTQSVLPAEKLTLNVESDCIDEQEKVVYTKAIKEYYTERYVGNEREIKRNWLLVGVLAVLGVLFLAAAIFFDNSLNQTLWAEVIDIVAWVFLWEAVDIGVFHCRSLRVKRLRYLSFIAMTINYHSVGQSAKEKSTD